MDILDGHTHAFNLGFLPIEGVLLSRDVPGWLASFITDSFEKALERHPPEVSLAMADHLALMDMLERELQSIGSGKTKAAITAETDLDLIAKFSLMLPESDLAALRPTLTAIAPRLTAEFGLSAGAGLPGLQRLLQEGADKNAKDRLTLDAALRAAAKIAGPVETSRTSRVELTATHGKTLGSLIDWLILLTQHEVRIARSFPSVWNPSATFAARVHLMMDMENHYPGRPPVYREIIRDQFPRMLAAAKASPIKMIGFVAFDPFRADCMEIVKTGIAQGFVGVKFYPPNGYRPIGNVDEGIVQYRNPPKKLTGADVDAANRTFFSWCIDQDIPVFTHCTNSGMESRPNETGPFSDPQGWQTLINSTFPNLRLCFGHAGGQDGWFASDDTTFGKSYAKTVVDLCCACPNVYCDFGYFDDVLDAANAKVFVKRLERVVAANAKFGERICYGTDWHLVSLDDQAPRYPSTFRSLIDKSSVLAPFADKFFGGNAQRYLKM